MVSLTMHLFVAIWTLGSLIRKAVVCFKCSLMGHSRSMGDSGAECDLINYVGLTKEVPGEKNFSTLSRDHSCDILVKKVSVFSLAQRRAWN